MNMKEIWKDIEGYEGLYQVSNMGRVKSLERTVWCGLNGGCYRAIPERIIKPSKDNYGYLVVNLWEDGKMKTYKVHRLVATAFIPNPNNLPVINHKNEIKNDNKVDNLEWCSVLYNNTYNDKAKKTGKKLKGRKLSEEHIKKLRGRKLSEETIRKIAEKQRNNTRTSKPVYSVDKVTGEIKEYPSAKEAERCTGIYHGSIIRCCRGERKSAGGHTWFYADDDTK